MRRTLGTSDIVVSQVGLGLNNLGRPGTATEEQAGTDRLIHAAIDHGITLLDTADMYGVPPTTSERLLGNALKGRRDQVVLATKWGHQDFPIPGSEDWGPKGGRRYVRNAVDASLTRLQTDWIDLYQLHTPDPSTPIATTIDALDELVEAGKIRAYGHSNLSGEQIREAAAVPSPNGFATAQDEYSLLARGVEADVLPAAREAGLGFLPYFPLYNGLLSGKYTRSEHPHDGRLTRIKPQLLEGVDWTQLEEYDRIARDAGLTMLEATFAWLLAQDPVVSVIAGATKPEQIAQNVAAGEARMSADVVAAISDLFS
ncbi:aldo/keto reductase [Agrococcus sp. SGAir0287]|uniref:aldo/keto reductase n=1 Tax=Agrococcus sp. SGAir0287 TaxID=2070347 RepID=UPI0010CD445B|nr:aldo/keto reductase [Agrococcus sp. SGAir0287]QCR19677.1 aldo/keto reductase [Agrococcus sp. SGAir0287]